MAEANSGGDVKLFAEDIELLMLMAFSYYFFMWALKKFLGG